MVYLDYAATTPLRPEVLETIKNALELDFGNPSSIYQIGKKTKRKISSARESIAKRLGIIPNNLYFTSGATEANNWAIIHQAQTARKLGKGNHIVASAIEHPSVRETLVFLEQEGFEITWIYPDENKHITLQAFEAASTSKTMGWVAMAINNEVGAILPTVDLGKSAKQLGYWFHVDGVQAIGHQLKTLIPYVTSLSVSAHKFYGPKGIGFLVYQPWETAMLLKPFIHGGSQESSKRAGTENTPYILGMAKALELSLDEAAETQANLFEINQYLIEQLDNSAITFAINGDNDSRANHIINLWLPGFSSSQLLIQMDLAEIFVSAGSACSAGSLEDSLILKAYYPDDSQRWQESIRLSFGNQTTKKDIDKFIAQLNLIKERNHSYGI